MSFWVALICRDIDSACVLAHLKMLVWKLSHVWCFEPSYYVSEACCFVDIIHFKQGLLNFVWLYSGISSNYAEHFCWPNLYVRWVCNRIRNLRHETFILESHTSHLITLKNENLHNVTSFILRTRDLNWHKMVSTNLVSRDKKNNINNYFSRTIIIQSVSFSACQMTGIYCILCKTA